MSPTSQLKPSSSPAPVTALQAMTLLCRAPRSFSLSPFSKSEALNEPDTSCLFANIRRVAPANLSSSSNLCSS